MSPMLRPAVAAALLLLVPSLALAQAATTPATQPSEVAKPAPDAASGGPGSGRGRSARLSVCRADLAKLCPDATKGARRTCLKDNLAKLSPECAAAFTDIEVKAKAMREACAGDVQAHCATAGKGKGGSGIVQCLRANEAKLTPACNTAVKSRYDNG